MTALTSPLPSGEKVIVRNTGLGIWCLIFYFLFRFAKISKGSPRIKAASAQRLWSKPVVLIERISGEKRLVSILAG